MPLSLRAATNDDHPWPDTLRRAVYKELFIATWGGWDEARHKRHFASFLAQNSIWIIQSDATDVGIVQLLDAPDHVTVEEIQILPHYQNTGIGTSILEKTIAKAQASNKDVCLSHGLLNSKAHRLYRRLGFEEYKRTDSHIYMRLDCQAFLMWIWNLSKDWS